MYARERERKRERDERRQMWGRGARKRRMHGGDIAFTHSPVVFRS